MTTRSATASPESKNHSIKPNERLLPLSVFSERVGMSIPWTRKKVHARELGFVKIGRRVLIPESELMRIIGEGFIPAKGER